MLVARRVTVILASLQVISMEMTHTVPELSERLQSVRTIECLLERLFDCDHPPLQTVANVVNYCTSTRRSRYISQLLSRAAAPLLNPLSPRQPPMLNARNQGRCFLHEDKFVHCMYSDLNGVMNIGCLSLAGFDRARLPVCYYRLNVSRAQELSREADLRSASFVRMANSYRRSASGTHVTARKTSGLGFRLTFNSVIA